MKQRFYWLIAILLFIAVLANGLALVQAQQVVDLRLGDAIWVACEGGELPVLVRPGIGQSIVLTCLK